jgi:hypothetical protein
MAKIKIRPHVPEGLAIIFEAPQRWGKTLGGVIWALDAYQTGRPIFSNIQLGFPHEPLDFENINLSEAVGEGDSRKSKFWGGHIFIDELNFYFDARRSMKGSNLEFGAFLLQQKKQGCNITGTTHNLESLDVRLRDNYDYLIKPSTFPRYPSAPQIIRMDISNGPLQARYHKIITLDCRPYLGLYDSFAVYDPFKEITPKEKKQIGSRVKL